MHCDVYIYINYIFDTFVVNTEYLWSINDEAVDLGIYDTDKAVGDRETMTLSSLVDVDRSVLLGVVGTFVPFF